MEAMLCIDFGNSYTKVALRKPTNPQNALTLDSTLSEAITDKSLVWDRLIFVCIPTIVAKVTEGAHARYLYGSEVLKLPQVKLNSVDIRVFRNWKPSFFDQAARGPMATPGHAAGQPAAPSTTMNVNVETQYKQWLAAQLEKNVAAVGFLNFEQWQAAVLPLLPSKGTPTNLGTAALDSAEIDRIATGYFRWLLEFMQACIGQTYPQLVVSEIPARITLPSFGPQGAAEARLIDILSRAGWKCADNPVVHEPFANAIGLFTQGRSVTWSPTTGQTECHYRNMFENTPFFKEMRRLALLPAAQRVLGPDPVYWILTIDIGGFTTDFSMIGMNMDELVFFDDSSDQNPRRFAKHSVVAGVQHLDDAVVEGVPAAKRDMLRQMMNAADQQPLETYHTTVYGRLDLFSHAGVKIMDTEDEKQAVVARLKEYAAEVCQALDQFMAVHQFPAVNELVLTGGGFNVPTIRDAVSQYVRNTYGAQVFTLPLQQDEQAQGLPSAQCRRISVLECRAATAVGGTSILFDELTND